MKYKYGSVWECNLCPSLHEDFCMYIVKDMDLNWSISISNNTSTVPYFNLHNNIDPGEATKVAKIRMDAPKYLDYYNDSLIKDWVLTDDEIDKLMKILMSHNTILEDHKLKKTVFHNMVYDYYDQILSYWPEHKQPIIHMPRYKNLKDLGNEPVSDVHLDSDWALEYNILGEHHSNCIACKYLDYDLNISIFVVKNNIDIPYFIMYDNIDPSNATKVTRIRLDKPEYLNYKSSYSSCYKSKWNLNTKDAEMLYEEFKQKHVFPEECTTYSSLYRQYFIAQYGRADLNFDKNIPYYYKISLT